MKRQLVLLTLFLLLLAGCDRAEVRGNRIDGPAAEENGTPESAAEVDPATPLPTLPAVGDIILADGQIFAVNPPLPLGFSTNGRLLAIHVNPGDKVAAGDLIATLDEETLQENVTSAELQVSQAETTVAQAQLSLDELMDWEPDELLVALAEANLAAAEAGYESALNQDAVAGNSLVASRINLEQAERALADTQKAYDQAWQEARDWELNIEDPVCLPGQGGIIPCSGPPMRERLEAERDATARALPMAEEAVTVARANYSLALAGLNNDSALNAEAAVASARQALEQAQTGPKEAEISAARLQLAQGELALQQAQFALEQARRALDDAALYAPWSGTVLSVDASVGTMVGAGVPVVTLLDTEHLQFQTNNLSERDLAYIEPGQSASITLKSYSGQSLAGTVLYVVSQASGQVGDAATFTVVIEVEPTDLALLSGMTGRVEIQRNPEASAAE